MHKENISIIATIGRPTEWNIVKYQINNLPYTTCASFIALSEHFRDIYNSSVRIFLIVPDSVNREDLNCLKEELTHHNLKDSTDLVFVEVRGEIGGVRYLGDIYAIPAAILCIASLCILNRSRIIFDLTHGWNVLPSLIMYTISLIKNLTDSQVFIAEPYVGRKGGKECGQLVKDEEIKSKLSILRLELPIEAQLNVSFKNIENAIKNIYMLYIDNFSDKSKRNNAIPDILINSVQAVEYFRNGIITLGWYHVYKILSEYKSINNVRNIIREILELILNNEIRIPEDDRKALECVRKVVKDNEIMYNASCSKLTLFQFLYEVLSFIVLLDVYERAGYFGQNLPGLSVKLDKVESIVRYLRDVKLMCNPVYLVVYENLRKAREDYNKYKSIREDFCEYQAKKLGSDRSSIDVIKRWRESNRKSDKDKVCRDIVAHSGLTCPIVRRFSSYNEFEINRERLDDIDKFSKEFIQYLLSS